MKIDAIVRGAAGKELPVLVPKLQYNDVFDARRKAEINVAERDTRIEELGKTAGLSEELKKQIDSLTTANKEANTGYDAEIKALRIDAALKLAIRTKVHDVDYALPQLDKNNCNR